MDAALGAEVAVREAAVDAQARALDAGRLALLVLEQRRVVAVLLGVARVHPEQHLGPVLALGPARARVDGHDGRAVVVRPGEHAAQLERVELLLERGLLGRDLGRQALAGLGLHLAVRRDVVAALHERVEGLDPLGLGRDGLLGRRGRRRGRPSSRARGAASRARRGAGGGRRGRGSGRACRCGPRGESMRGREAGRKLPTARAAPRSVWSASRRAQRARPVGLGHEEVVVVDARDDVARDADLGERSSDCGRQPDRREVRVNRQRDPRGAEADVEAAPGRGVCWHDERQALRLTDVATSASLAGRRRRARGRRRPVTRAEPGRSVRSTGRGR